MALIDHKGAWLAQGAVHAGGRACQAGETGNHLVGEAWAKVAPRSWCWLDSVGERFGVSSVASSLTSGATCGREPESPRQSPSLLVSWTSPGFGEAAGSGWRLSPERNRESSCNFAHLHRLGSSGGGDTSAECNRS